MKAKVQTVSFPPDRRVLAISDIHGNLAYLRGVLKKAAFSQGDILVLVGDMLEKGPESLETLRYIMQLQETYTVYPLCGNCDGWHAFLTAHDADMDAHVRAYILHPPGKNAPGLLAQMCLEAGIPLTEDLDVQRLRETLPRVFSREFAFLQALPTIVDTPRFTFVHGGLPEGRLEDLDAYACMKNDNFLRQGRKFDKWVIVGHWPVMLYGGDITCANPIVDYDAHIVSIDGGCVLKDDGQLNALILPRGAGEDFTWVAYDRFPVRRVLSDQAASERSTYIRWGDNAVEVLERGAEFSRCRHVRTGYELDILTKYLEGEGRFCTCNDCTDYVLPLKKGDSVSLIETTSRGYLVKHQGVSGWYFGALGPEEA